MTFSDSTTQNRTNGHKPAETVAERHAARRAAGAIWPPVNPAAVKLGAKLRPWLLGAVLGLLVGAAGMFYISAEFSPLAGAVAVRNGIVVSELDGARYFLVSGWAVPLPKADGQ